MTKPHLDVFLREHAVLHSRDAAGSKSLSMDWVWTGLTEEQLRARPHGLNSVAWILWHVARVEDKCIAEVVVGTDALLDDAWTARLGVEERGDGEGMTKEAVAALSEAIDVEGLFAYRDAVCRRTREIVPDLGPERWHAPFTEDEIRDRVARGAIPADEAPRLADLERDGLLWWWGVEHTHYHLGQIAALRGLLQAS